MAVRSPRLDDPEFTRRSPTSEEWPNLSGKDILLDYRNEFYLALQGVLSFVDEGVVDSVEEAIDFVEIRGGSLSFFERKVS